MANLIDLSTTPYRYPVSEAQLRSEHPDVSGPLSEFLVVFNLAVVFPAPPPTFDPITQGAREVVPVLTDKGHWEQAYEIYELTPEQIAENKTRIVQQNNANIKSQIAELDLRRIRPLAEGDTTFLSTLNAQITTLRAQLA